MTKLLKHISRIHEDFDVVICGVNGVLTKGTVVDDDCLEALVQLYQSGKKIALTSNSGLRVNDLFGQLKNSGVPMNIFYAMITAGEIAHFYLKKHQELGTTYFPITSNQGNLLSGLALQKVDSVVMADFILAETTADGIDVQECMPILEQALSLHLPFVCVGNNTVWMTQNGVKESVGALAEKYAMMGGEILSFGKPDLRIAQYLTEEVKDIKNSRCLIIGDSMATDMRLGNSFAGKTLLVTNGVHQLKANDTARLDELSTSYGLNVDYCMESLKW